MGKWPAHNDPKEENAAKAPYNFVPLPERIVTVDPNSLPDHDRYDPDRHTGWIDCVLTTASPLYVRTAFTWKQYEQSLDEKAEKQKPWHQQVKNTPDFFYTVDPSRPVIPGSSLRGMLRSLVEIVSYSKVQDVAVRRLVYRAVGEGDKTDHGRRYRDRLMQFDGQGKESGKPYRMYTPLMQAGYMTRDENGEWAIRPARQINGTTYARISHEKIEGIGGIGVLQPWNSFSRNANEIWVSVTPPDYQKVRGGFIRIKRSRVLKAAAASQPGLMKACLARSGWMESKRSEAVVFEPDEKAKLIPIDDELIRDYRDSFSDVYAEQVLHGQEKTPFLGSGGVLEVGKPDEPGQPVFYLMEKGKLVFFSHCQMLRIPYPASARDFVPVALRDEGDVDLAEAIFGYTKSRGDGKARAYAGRVFVTDATLMPDQDPDEVWLMGKGKTLTPKILGTPKPTTFQHYLTQQNPDPIPLPGKRAEGGKQRFELRLSDYASATPREAVIRGSKQYWHKGNVGAKDIGEAKEPDDSDKQHTRIKPVKEGVRFEFTIRFENLSDVELGALLWVLDIAQNDAYRLKLGMGKPYGMGAVKVTHTLHLEDRINRYKRLFTTEGWAAGAPKEDAREMALQRFESFVPGNVERIRMLMAMLRWPGPNPKMTQYLELKEHRERRVLPGPLAMKAPSPRRAGAAQPPQRNSANAAESRRGSPSADETARTGE